MVVVYGVPDWAARAAARLRARRTSTARSRPITDAGPRRLQEAGRLAAGPGQARGRRHQLVEPVERAQRPVLHQPAARAVHGLVEVAGARRLRQARPRDARGARSPGQQLVVGELAGLKNARKYGTSISEFFDGLPDDVVCNAGVFAQHAVLQARRRGRRPRRRRAASRTSLDRRAVHQAASRSGSPRAASAARTSATSARPRTRASAPTARRSTCRCAAGTTTRAWTPSSSTPSATTRSSRSAWPTRS